MARVLLLTPRLPQPLGSPYLGQQYVAAALLRAGHEVRCLDLAATHWEAVGLDFLDAAHAFAPQLVGFTLFTINALEGYRLRQTLTDLDALFVAGGPHVAAAPVEPLDFGFDVCVPGEGEHTLVELAASLERGGPLEHVPGVIVNKPQDAGGPAYGPVRETIAELDALPFPSEALGCYDPLWYGVETFGAVCSLISSRGCPARCTFCANHVTGRVFRYRSVENVLLEMRELSSRFGVRHFPFHDDAFTARADRVEQFCEQLRADPALRGVTWGCITPANMVRAELLKKMAAAGCVSINFGLESGSRKVLKAIKKGLAPERFVESLVAAKAAGIRTVVNVMFGFPEEGAEELEETLSFMEELVPLTDFFNNRGVLIPFPGTPIYEQFAQAYGFERWWLELGRIPPETSFTGLSGQALQGWLEADPTLEVNFFHYDAARRRRIEECVRFKARHNADTIARQS